MFQHRGALDHVLSPDDYSDADFHARELDRLFEPHWHFAGLAGALGNGDRVRVLGREVSLRREGDRLRAFAAVDPAGAGAAPAEPPPGEIHVEELGGMAFVSFALSPEPLREMLGAFADEFERAFGHHRLVWDWVTEHDVNWKVIAENAVESYHVPVAHPNTFQAYRPEQLHDHRLAERYTAYRDLKPWERRPSDRVFAWTARALLREPDMERFTQAHVFPNVLLYYGDLFSSFIVLEPLGPERTRHRQLGFVPRDVRAGALGGIVQALFARGFVAGVKRIMREDMRLWPDIHRGLKHSHHRGVLSRREERVHAFQCYVANRVHAHAETADA